MLNGNGNGKKGYYVVILDDDMVVRESLTLYLEEIGYHVVAYASGFKLLEEIDTIPADILICDFCMPDMNGLEFLEKVQVKKRGLPVILATGYGNFEMAKQAISLGVKALFSKPFNLKTIRKTIRHLIAEHIVDKRKKDQAVSISERLTYFRQAIEDSNERYRNLVYSSVEALLNSLEIKDHYTKMHSKRVSEYIGVFARELKLDARSIYDFKLAGIFHDIGKIGINEAILNKREPLTKEEFETIKTHPLISEYILQPLDIFSPVIEVIRAHHERYDGGGYPCGLKGSEMPFGARIMGIVDAYDAMSTARPYRSALALNDIIDEFEKYKGLQFDPELTECFIRFIKKGIFI